MSDSSFIQDLEKTLIAHEGMRLNPYRCTAQKLTIGVGHNLENGITEKQALMILRDDIDVVIETLNDRIPWWNNLSDGKKVVMASMAFQLGTGGFFQFKKMIKAAEYGDDVEVVTQMRDSRWYLQTPNRVEELIKRWTK